jgi:hypothetical protein
MRWLVRALALTTLAAPVARAQTSSEAPPQAANPEVERHVADALRLYDQGRFDEAIVEMEAAWAGEHRPDFLYFLGQAERRRHRCDRAVRRYREFLETAPLPVQAGAARYQIEQCQGALGPAAPPAGTPAPPPAPPPRRRLFDDPLGDVLTGIGAAAVVTCGVLWLRADDTVGDGGKSYSQYASARSARDDRTLAAIGVAAGGALVAAGAFRLWLHARSPSGQLALLPTVTAAGAMAVLEGPL